MINENKKKKLMTLSFLIKNNQILLAMKKRGFGVGRYNGYGGKVQEGETIEQAAKREIEEESGLKKIELEQRGIITFDLERVEDLLEVHIYKIINFESEPIETEEMKPRWFDLKEIPYMNMWPDDKYWLPTFLKDKKFRAEFKFDKDDEVLDYNIKEVEEL